MAVRMSGAAMASNLTYFPHPLTPPTTEEDRLAWLRLIRSHRVGVSTFFRLLSEHGSAGAALAALPAIAGAAGVAGYSPCPIARAEAELATGRRLGARLLCFGEADYPSALQDIPDPPPVLWALGDLSLLHRPQVALVGARNASSLGLRMASRMASELGAAGLAVVSGLARGIDAAAHAAALETGTVAVLGGGIDVLYPAENADLAHRIGQAGLRLSEQPPGMEPMARHFPLRNRIIAGLSRAVVVVEAAARSGSLMTARLAAEQGREVMAVPGHPFDARASGCNILIRDGALLVRGAEDVLTALAALPAFAPGHYASPDGAGVVPGPARPRRTGETRPLPADDAPWLGAEAGAGAAESLAGRILGRLGPSPLSEDALIRDLALPVAALAPEILALELDGRIHRHPGGFLSLAS